MDGIEAGSLEERLREPMLRRQGSQTGGFREELFNTDLIVGPIPVNACIIWIGLAQILATSAVSGYFYETVTMTELWWPLTDGLRVLTGCVLRLLFILKENNLTNESRNFFRANLVYNNIFGFVLSCFVLLYVKFLPDAEPVMTNTFTILCCGIILIHLLMTTPVLWDYHKSGRRGGNAYESIADVDEDPEAQPILSPIIGSPNTDITSASPRSRVSPIMIPQADSDQRSGVQSFGQPSQPVLFGGQLLGPYGSQGQSSLSMQPFVNTSNPSEEDVATQQLIMQLLQTQNDQASRRASVRNEQDREYEAALVQQLIRDTEPETPHDDVITPREVSIPVGDDGSPKASFVAQDSSPSQMEEKQDQEVYEFPLELPSEPEDGPDVVYMRLKLSDGSNIFRNFLRSDTIRDVRTFIYQQIDERMLPRAEFRLVTTRPRQLYEDLDATLESCKFWVERRQSKSKKQGYVNVSVSPVVFVEAC